MLASKTICRKIEKRDGILLTFALGPTIISERNKRHNDVAIDNGYFNGFDLLAKASFPLSPFPIMLIQISGDRIGYFTTNDED